MFKDMPEFSKLIKPVLCVLALIVMAFYLSSCSVNPATGQQQFAALMSPAQEVQVGAQEHGKIAQTFKLSKPDQALHEYVNVIGQDIAQYTERPDVKYSFYVIDDPMVNAFALPGGYIYVTRGLMAQANSEAELAAVIAHEIGHVTGRHSAARYSRGVLTSLGATALSIALDNGTASQALGVGSDLFIKSYSRQQEHEADGLGVRYLHRTGYDVNAMASFLANLQAHSALESTLSGRNGGGGVFNYFSTHPETGERVARTMDIAASFPANEGRVIRNDYLRRLDGMVYGDSPEQGFVRDNHFYHTGLGFTFSAPEGFRLINQPEQVIATNGQGSVMIFDAAKAEQPVDAMTYLTQIWLRGESTGDVERIEINGMNAATASFESRVDNRRAIVRVIAIEWEPDMFYRFQLAMPLNAPGSLVEDLKRSTYSFRALSTQEKRNIQPYRVRIVTAQAGDTVSSLARRMPFKTMQDERFRVLNGLTANDMLRAGETYKIVSAR